MAYRQTEQTLQKRADREKTFLDAARDLWLERGYGGVAMAEVARKAGSSVGNLYFYYKDRDDLMAAVLTGALAPVRDCIDRAMDGPGRIHVRISRALLRGVQLILEDRVLLSFCFKEQLSPRVEAVLREALSERMARFLTPRAELYYPQEMALLIWHGSISETFRAVTQGRLPADAPTLAAGLIRWNFLALGLGKATVQRLLDNLVAGEGPRGGVEGVGPQDARPAGEA